MLIAKEYVAKAWSTLKIEIVFAPHTGNIKPWEIYGIFSFPHNSRVHWGSFKTEESAKKKLSGLLKKYPQAIANNSEERR